MAQEKYAEGRGRIISVLQMLETLWLDRYVVAAGTALCIAAAITVSLLLPATYESRATLLLQPPPYRDVKAGQSNHSDELSGLLPKVLGVQDYAVLLTSDSVLVEAVERVKASGKFPAQTIENLSHPSVLNEALSIETTVNERTAYGTEYAPTLILTGRASSAELAQVLAQAWAEVSVEKSAEFYRSGKSGLLEFMEERVATTRGELAKAFEQQREVETAWDSGSMRTRIDQSTVLLTMLEKDRATKRVELQGLRGEIEALNNAIAEEDPTLVLWKSPPMESVFLEDALQGPRSVNGGERKGYQEEEINPVYYELRRTLADRQAKLKGLEAEEASLTEGIDATLSELQRLREENAKYSSQSKMLGRDAGAFTKSYDLLASKLEQAKVAESEQQSLADLKIVARAVAPDRKISPNRTAIVLAAAFLGLLVSAAGVVVRKQVEVMGVKQPSVAD